MSFRIIHGIKDEVEEIYITEDLKSPASDFLVIDVESDTIIEDDLPSTFPTEHRFRMVG